MNAYEYVCKNGTITDRVMIPKRDGAIGQVTNGGTAQNTVYPTSIKLPPTHELSDDWSKLAEQVMKAKQQAFCDELKKLSVKAFQAVVPPPPPPLFPPKTVAIQQQSDPDGPHIPLPKHTMPERAPLSPAPQHDYIAMLYRPYVSPI